MANKPDKAYAAGLFDGEGSVTIAANRGVKSARGTIYNMRCGVAQNDIRPLLWLRDRWGGTIYQQKRRTAAGNPTHQWWIFARKAAAFLTDVRPHLQVKAERADLALFFQAQVFNPGVTGHSDEYRLRAATIRSDLGALNGHKALRRAV